MRYLEHRRHSIRRSPSIHLSREGVELARKVGETMGNFDFVVTSYVERAWETAIAMGFSVDKMKAELFVYGDHVIDEIINETTFSGLNKKLDQNIEIQKFTRFHLNFIIQMLNKINDGESLLIISHGIIIDLPLLIMFPNADYDKWGTIMSYCDGYRVKYDGNIFSDLEILRSS